MILHASTVFHHQLFDFLDQVFRQGEQPLYGELFNGGLIVMTATGVSEMSEFARPIEIRRFVLTALHAEKALGLFNKLNRKSDRYSGAVPPDQPKRLKFPKYLLEQGPKLRDDHSSWMTDANVVGYATSSKKSGGAQRPEESLTVYVRKKLPKSKCNGRMVPPEITVRRMARPILTDVVSVGDFRIHKNDRRNRPAPPGFSIGHINGGTGTFGCLVQKTNGIDPHTYILSSAHVIARSGLAATKSKIVQPGIDDDTDGDPSNDVVGKLWQWVEFQFAGSSGRNTFDAAIARVTGDVTSAIDNFGVPKGSSRRVKKGDRVKLSGRTSGSGLTEGTVEATDFTTSPVEYPRSPTSNEAIRFYDQVLCSRFAESGDSGAAVLNRRNKVVGLHFGGADSISVFNKIGYVLNTFKVKVVTSLV